MKEVLDRGTEDARRLVAWLDEDSPAWRLRYIGHSIEQGKIRLNLKGGQGWFIDAKGREEAFLAEWKRLVKAVVRD
jgi:hypothetical protein